jgi:hypothetical protein
MCQIYNATQHRSIAITKFSRANYFKLPVNVKKSRNKVIPLFKHVHVVGNLLAHFFVTNDLLFLNTQLKHYEIIKIINLCIILAPLIL